MAPVTASQMTTDTMPRACLGLGPLGLAGFFCNGEIGPVGQKSFLHGFTASLALFVKK